MQTEEEFNFRDRLKEVGRVKYDWTPVYTSGRRHRCQLTKTNRGEYCEDLKIKKEVL